MKTKWIYTPTHKNNERTKTKKLLRRHRRRNPNRRNRHRRTTTNCRSTTNTLEGRRRVLDFVLALFCFGSDGPRFFSDFFPGGGGRIDGGGRAERGVEGGGGGWLVEVTPERCREDGCDGGGGERNGFSHAPPPLPPHHGRSPSLVASSLSMPVKGVGGGTTKKTTST